MRVRQRATTPPLERLMRRAYRSSGPLLHGVPCLLFPFSLNSGGYGAIRVEGRTRMAHAVSWEAQVGPVPDGLELDHLCRVRTCIEILHLEPVTHRENDLRGASPAIQRHLTGVCVRGHRFAPGSQCKECVNARQREAYRWLRANGRSPREATKLRGNTEFARAAGWSDLRGGGTDQGSSK